MSIAANDLEVRAKAVPYYVCMVIRILSEQEAYTLDALVSASFNRESLTDNTQLPFRLSDKSVLQDALKFLESEFILEYVTDEFGPDLVIRHPNFATNIGGLFRREGTVFAKYSLAGERKNEWLVEALDKINQILSLSGESKPTPSSISEAEEGDWEPLPVERDNPLFQAAIESSEKALEVIEQNNGYAATHPDERNGIVKTIRGTLEALKHGAPSRAVVIEGLIKPFRFVASKFSEGIMSEFAKVAVTALMKWLF